MAPYGVSEYQDPAHASERWWNLRLAVIGLALDGVSPKAMNALYGVLPETRCAAVGAARLSEGLWTNGTRMIESQAVRRELSRDEIASQLRALGVKLGGVLLVHTSFRAVGSIEGGPRGLIEALRAALGPNGTLVMPSWTGDDDKPFDPTNTPASPDLGVVPDTFWRLPGVVRSTHPFAFAASGPQAAQISSGPLSIPPHIPESPVSRVHELDGQVLLLGVGHDTDTMLHLAELLAGVPYRVPKHCTVFQDGRSVRIDYGENDHCCARFAFADEWLRERGLQSEGCVGHAYARLARARNVVGVALEHLAHDPFLFLHPPSAGCVECDEARRSIVG